jgi:nicotinate-nucleotide pyrophosphorylase
MSGNYHRNVIYRAFVRLDDGVRTVGEISDIIANAYNISPFLVRIEVRCIIAMSA